MRASLATRALLTCAAASVLPRSGRALSFGPRPSAPSVGGLFARPLPPRSDSKRRAWSAAAPPPPEAAVGALFSSGYSPRDGATEFERRVGRRSSAATVTSLLRSAVDRVLRRLARGASGLRGALAIASMALAVWTFSMGGVGAAGALRRVGVQRRAEGAAQRRPALRAKAQQFGRHR